MSEGNALNSVCAASRSAECSRAGLLSFLPGLPGLPGLLRLLRLLRLWDGGYDDDLSVLLAAAVNPTQALDEPLPCDDVAHHVVGIEVDPDFASSGRKDERIGGDGFVAPRKKAKPNERLGGLLSLVNSSAADEQFGFGFGSTVCPALSQGLQRLHRLFGVVATAGEYQHPDSTLGGNGEFPRLVSELPGELLRRDGVPYDHVFRCVVARADDRVSEVCFGESEDRGMLTPGRRERHQLNRRDAVVDRCRSRLHLGLMADLLDEPLERRDEVRLVEDEQGVGTEKTRLIRPHLSRNAVALEQKPRADHVDGADDDAWTRRVVEPFAIVYELAAKRGDGQLSPVIEPQRSCNAGVASNPRP